MSDRQFKSILVHTAVYPWLAMVLFTAVIACQTSNFVNALDDFNKAYGLSAQMRTVYQALTDLTAVQAKGFDQPVDQSLRDFDRASRRVDAALAAAQSASVGIHPEASHGDKSISDLKHIYTRWAGYAKADLRGPRNLYTKMISTESRRRFTSDINDYYFGFNESLSAVLAVRCRSAAQYWVRVFACGATLAFLLGGFVAWHVVRHMFALRRTYTGVIAQLSASNTRLEAGLEKAAEALREQQAWSETTTTVDLVTGLKNRACFVERLSEEFQRCLRYDKALSVMLLEIDRFDDFTDQYGPESGDEMLESVGALLRSCCRATDLVARYEGCIFAFLLPETDAPSSQELAERIRRTVAGRVSERWSPTISGGISSFQHSSAGEELLLDEASDALRICKSLGRNRVIHHFFAQSIVASAR